MFRLDWVDWSSLITPAYARGIQDLDFYKAVRIGYA